VNCNDHFDLAANDVQQESFKLTWRTYDYGWPVSDAIHFWDVDNHYDWKGKTDNGRMDVGGLNPNTHYIVELGYYSWPFYQMETSLHLHVITTPYYLTRSSDLSSRGYVDDLAYSKIHLQPGFYYKPRNSTDKYHAGIITGTQQWIKCLKSLSIENLDSTFNEKNFASNEANILIFPNPTDGILHIKNVNKLIYEVYVLNSYGQTILEKQNAEIVDLSSYPSGIYFVKIKSDKFEIVRKIIKQ
jgi:hypothetical protein